MKNLLTIAMMTVAFMVAAQENVKTTQVTHLLSEPNQATFDKATVIESGQ